MAQKYRVGVLAVGGPDWFGGLQYTNTMLRALAATGEVKSGKINGVYILTYQDGTEGLDKEILKEDGFHILSLPQTHLGKFTSKTLGPISTELAQAAWLTGQYAVKGLDLIVPAPRKLAAVISKRAIPWIPDFQHCTMPEFFPIAEYDKRQYSFGLALKKAKTLILSSESAHEDAQTYFEDIQARIRVLRFYVDFPVESFQCDPAETLAKYNLTKSFLLCANQFWAHKNHRLLFEALAIAKTHVPDIQLVCTGRLTDSRSAEYIDNWLREAAILGIMPNIKILGFIPRHDQLQILRAAHAVVQPSLSEGWSTIVEESRCFDRPILMSDIKVHLEQAPPHANYFEARNKEALVEKLIEVWKKAPHVSMKNEELMKRAAKSNEAMGNELTEIIFEHLEEFC